LSLRRSEACGRNQEWYLYSWDLVLSGGIRAARSAAYKPALFLRKNSTTAVLYSKVWYGMGKFLRAKVNKSTL
jgi:hypothetical protein